MKSVLVLVARRYIAGADRKDAIEVALGLNSLGIGAIIDNLGENVTDASDAEGSVAEYTALLDEIKAAGADATVSLKLTHLGLDISDKLAMKGAERIVRKAAGLDNLVRIDMEGSAYTQRTIDIFERLRRRYNNVGIALQSCLLRSEADASAIASLGGSIRLVKGAYKEPASVAFQDKRDVDENFERIIKALLLTDTRPAIATHDERLIDSARAFASGKGISKDSFDFEMLLGIKRGLQKRLAAEGWRVRVYIPYGKNWLPYTLRRLRERKENVWFLLRHIFER